MSDTLSIAFLWHMHQPWYHDPATGGLTLPWVRLHAAKDYVDMVALLEDFPAIHQTFNVTPCLLKQLGWYEAGGQDAWEELAAKPSEALTPEETNALTHQCLFAHLRRMIGTSTRYYELVARTQRGQSLSPQEIRDLTVWFQLVWIDPRWRRADPALAALAAKGQLFTEEDKALVLARHRALVAKVVPTYRRAQERGQIEVSTSPYSHPILPLLATTDVAREATPGLVMPRMRFAEPADVHEHLQRGVAVYEECFGRRPRGLWPPEGSVSQAILPAAAAAGFQWLATDEAILWKSLPGSSARQALYQPYRVAVNGSDLAIVFRDRTLSDLIGFSYASQPASAAVGDFLHRLHQIRHELSAAAPLVVIILDGENAWEHYPEDGQEFLRRLYEGITQDASLRCVTVSEYLAEHGARAALPNLAPGSWIRGDFTTWIGETEKNDAWDALAQTREAYRQRAEHPKAAAAYEHILAAEGSDWFWWYGPEHNSAHDAEFDRLFRQHLIQVYTTLDLPVPASLTTPILREGVSGAVAPTRWVSPVIDGQVTDYFEWLYAGRLECTRARGAMAPGRNRLERLWWGCDKTHWYLRLDVPAGGRPDHLTVVWTAERPKFSIEVHMGPEGVRAVWSAAGQTAKPAEQVAAQQIVELKIPLRALGLRPGATVEGALQLLEDGVAVETVPPSGRMILTLPGESDGHAHWSA